MSGLRSRNKGKRGERHLALQLRRIGFTDAARGVQYRGGPDSPDVTGIPGLHLECKFTEKLNVFDAMQQAWIEKGSGEIPVVAHRRSNKPWVVILELNHIVGFANAIHQALGYTLKLEERSGGDS